MKTIYLFLSGSLMCFLFSTETCGQVDLVPEITNLSNTDKPDTSFFASFISEPARFTLRHELSYKFGHPESLKNNRTSFRLEYSKYFLKNFQLQFDSKLNGFWIEDHRAKAKDKKMFFENNFIEAFLQFSIKQTSIKAGIQKMIWGESEAGAITDVISPRDYSELFFISLEESRRGQPMISVDQFTRVGDLTVFFVPFPNFNRYPKKGTAYYYDPFNGNALYQDEDPNKETFEFGFKWKKTFGGSDISFMAASLVDNDYSYRMDGFTTEGQVIVTKIKERFNMIGTTFNHVRGNFILKGEAAVKLGRAFNDNTYQIVKKDAINSALGLEFSPGGGTFSMFLEVVNNHIVKWNDQIMGSPRNTNSVVFSCRKALFNQDLSISVLSIYNSPYNGFLYELLLSYKWNDNLTIFMDGYFPDIRSSKNGNWIYRDQKQFDFKLQYQF